MKHPIRSTVGRIIAWSALAGAAGLACTNAGASSADTGTLSSDIACMTVSSCGGGGGGLPKCGKGYVLDDNDKCVLACTLQPGGCATPIACPYSPECPPGQYSLVPSPSTPVPNPLPSDPSTLAPAQCSFTAPSACQAPAPAPTGNYYVEPAFTAPVVTSVAIGAHAVYAIAAKAPSQLAPGEDASQSTAVYAWGTNSNYELGDNTTAPHTTSPTTVLYVPAHPVIQIAAGDEGACALLENGPNNVYCWGTIVSELGGITYTYPMTPWLPTDNAPTITQITHGQRHACALSNEAVPAVYCWGDNDKGQLGQPTSLKGSESPVAVTTIPTVTSSPQLPNQSVGKIQSVVASGNSTCVLSEAGYIFCWGDDAVGSLGDNNANNGAGQPTPQPVPTKQRGGNYLQFNANSLIGGGVGSELGTGSFCASYNYAGSLYWQCWGANDRGQIDLTPTVPSTTDDFNTGVNSPTDLLTFDSLIASAPSIALGGRHGCAWGSLLAPGLNQTPRCWGSNEGGQLGNQSASSTAKAPVLSSLVNMTNLPTLYPAGATPEFDAFAVGGDLTCAVYLNSSKNYGTPTANGNLACWGTGEEFINTNKPTFLTWH